MRIITIFLNWVIFIIFLRLINSIRELLPLCHDDDHINGVWQHNTTVQKAFHCCGWDNNDYLHNTTLCGNSTPNKTFYHGSNEIFTAVGCNACICDIVDNTRDIVNKREQYEWMPTFCRLLSWNATLFCNLLNGRRIAMIGDSTIIETASTLMNMIKNGNGECADQIIYIRSNYLIFSLKTDVNLKDALLSIKPNISIINAGAHLEDEGDMLYVLSYLTNILENVEFNHIKFIWRSIIPGHYNCHGIESPKYFSTSTGEDKFHWNYFPLFDSMAKNFTKFHNISWLDMSPLYWRSDAHASFINRDCLHYCMPGPINLFSLILLQKLYLKEI